MSLSIKKIPVFVFPNSLKFYLASKTTHKQLLTLYNPYDFPVRFKVSCTAPNKYAVIDPEGSIGPRMLVDIVIRHTMPIPANCNVTDKFRISMQDHTHNIIIVLEDSRKGRLNICICPKYPCLLSIYFRWIAFGIPKVTANLPDPTVSFCVGPSWVYPIKSSDRIVCVRVF
nr:unnamed protein product [Callosobruchus chinensis]